jgi:zinc protease
MNNPVAKAFLEFRQEFFRNHPYSTSPLGKLQDLQNLTTEMCREFYRTWYSPDNAVLVIVGDFEEALLPELVTRHFGQKKNGGTRSELSASAFDVANVTHRMKRKVEFDVPVLIVGYPAPPSSHKDAVALEILQLVVSGGESSRLHREVVRRQSVAVMVGGMNHMLKRAGMSMFFAAFTPDVSVGKVEKSLLEQITKVKNEGITSTELEKVKNTTLTSRTFELYTADNICHRIGYSECVEGDYRLWVERLEALRLLDKDRLMEIARLYWDDTKNHVLHLQPRKLNPLLYFGGLIRRVFSKHGQAH